MAPWGQSVNPLGPKPVPLNKTAPWGHTSDPVAGPENTPLETAIINVLARNEDTGNGPASVRALAREIVRLQGNDPDNHATVEDWRRRLRRYMTGERGYVEETRALIARAARARPGEIPPSPPRGDLRQLAEDLARENRELRAELDRLRENS